MLSNASSYMGGLFRKSETETEAETTTASPVPSQANFRALLGGDPEQEELEQSATAGRRANSEHEHAQTDPITDERASQKHCDECEGPPFPCKRSVNTRYGTLRVEKSPSEVSCLKAHLQRNKPLVLERTGSAKSRLSTPINVLESIFGFEDKIYEYMQQDDFDQAYTLMKRKLELGPELCYAREQVKFFKVAMLSRHSDKANLVRARIAKTIVDQIPSVTAQEVESLANYFREKQRLPEAVLFYLVAADYYSKMLTGRRAASGVANCCSGIRNANKQLLSAKPCVAKPLVQHHVVPLMRELRDLIQRIRNVDPAFMYYCEAHCLHCIEYTQGHIEDYESCETTLKEGILLMETRLGVESKKYRVYATLLHNLGYAYEVTMRLDDAYKVYCKAILADRSAIDYRTERERRANIEAGEQSLRRVEEKRKKQEVTGKMQQARKLTFRDIGG